MKKIVLIFLTLMLSNCSPKLRSTILKTLPSLSENELVVVLSITDQQIINEEKIGEIKATDSGFSENCSYYENIQSLKMLARKAGANLIKITRYNQANKFSTCDRLWADIYKVETPKKYESEIEWSKDRKLTWDDFKGKPNKEEFPDALAVTNSSIGYQSGINLFKNGKVFVQTLFYTNNSWYLPEGKNDYVLKHEQIHFDITEIYSRMLRKALADANVTSNNNGKAEDIFNDIVSKWKERQEYYDYNTRYSKRKDTQEKWEAIIELELAKYDLYKSN
ncbi:MAG: hypothetical protein WBF67_12535 [Olleya sp.]